MENSEKTILNEVDEIIYSDRRQQYGDFSKQMAHAAHLASVAIRKNITTEELFKIMMCVKLSRDIVGGPKHDNLVDLIGYTAGLSDFRKTMLNEQEASQEV